jgi:hypothetical protein
LSSSFLLLLLVLLLLDKQSEKSSLLPGPLAFETTKTILSPHQSENSRA